MLCGLEEIVSASIPTRDLVAMVAAARRDHQLVLLEGLHPWKHASRFGAIVRMAVTADRPELERLIGTLAPDLDPASVDEVDQSVWQQLAPRDTSSPLLAVAEARDWTVDDIGPDGHVVVLDRPRHAGNVGASIRAAAAANAAGVVTLGGVDPWSTSAVRGAAGLQYAVPTVRLDEHADLAAIGRPTIALDPDGPALEALATSPTAWVFGTERDGLDPAVRDSCDRTASLPMRAGVSSLNLAVAVGVVLYLSSRPATSV
jgi:TrmH family RNA methyltransferase